jgi:hypothetical protein
MLSQGLRMLIGLQTTKSSTSNPLFNRTFISSISIAIPQDPKYHHPTRQDVHSRDHDHRSPCPDCRPLHRRTPYPCTYHRHHQWRVALDQKLPHTSRVRGHQDPTPLQRRRWHSGHCSAFFPFPARDRSICTFGLLPYGVRESVFDFADRDCQTTCKSFMG